MLMVAIEGVRETIVCHALSTPASSCLDCSYPRVWLEDGREQRDRDRNRNRGQGQGTETELAMSNCLATGQLEPMN